MEKRVTVFTPTYNRKHLIHHCYESLLRQTNKSFKWLIIDDGSTDDTGKLVQQWIEDGKIDISYYYKPNGGLHTGYNAAIERLDTELAVCIDSDDWLPDNGIERIITRWDDIDDPKIAGLIGLDYTSDGLIIGDHLQDGQIVNPISLLASKNNRGDKKYVVMSQLYKTVAPMPVYEGEKNFNPHYMILKLSAKYKFMAVDEPLCIVDYQMDGMSANIFKQYINSPKSFAELRRVIMGLEKVPVRYLCKTVIHYVSSNILAKNRNYIIESPRPILTTILWPAGWLLSRYVLRNSEKIVSVRR